MENLFARRQALKKKFRGRERIFGAWTSLSHPSITEIFSRIGVDFIGIDVEHSTINQEQSQRIIAASQGNRTLCLPRIASHNAEMTRRLLDSGADGIIVPNISTAEDVEAVIQWSKYPPIGKRGYGIARGQGYGFDFDEYTSKWNESSTLIIQIESIQAVKNIDKILFYDAIDGVMIGPYDISGSLGIPGQIEHSKVKDAATQVINACVRHSKACGTQVTDPNEKNIKEQFNAGYTFVVLASDIFLLWKWSARMKEIVDKQWI